jgi:integrase/recombinase XerC
MRPATDSTRDQPQAADPDGDNKVLSLVGRTTTGMPATFAHLLRESWILHLKSRNMSDKTIRIYGHASQQFLEHLDQQTEPVPLPELRREHVEAFLTTYAETRAPATVSLTYRALQQWFAWLLDEGEIDADPTARMQGPIVPEKPVPVLTDDQLRALLATCAGRTMVARRDNAILRLFIDSGPRLSELAMLEVADLHLQQLHCRVLGKGRRERLLPFGARTAEALDRYLRIRNTDRQAALPGLWLGEKGKGPMTPNGVYQMIRRRGVAAGIPDLHPHQFRHTSAHRWLVEGGNEGDLMQIAGWRSRTMLQRYASSAAGERARDAHRKLGIADRL